MHATVIAQNRREVRAINWTSLVGLRPCSPRGYMLWRICGWCQCHIGKVQIRNSNYIWNV